MIYDNTTNVGINTTTPRSLFEVNGSMRGSDFSFAPSGSPSMGSPSNSPKMFFSSSYGTSSIKLEVLPEGTVSFMGTAGGLFEVVDSISGSLMSVNDASGLPILEVFSDDKVVAGKYNANTFVVTGSSVAIGKSVPNAKFDVSGSAVISGSLNVTSSFTVRGTTNLYGVVNSFGTTNSVNIYGGLSTGIGLGSSDVNVDIGVGRTNDGNAYLNFVSEGTSGTYPFYGLLIAKLSGASGKSQLIHRGTGDFEIKTNEAAAISLQTSGTEKVRITSGGNVGIGTSTPNAKLDVNGNTVVTGSVLVRSTTSTGVAVSSTTGTAFTANVSSGTDRYFLNFTGAVNSLSVYENSNIPYINSYSSMTFRANQIGGSGGTINFSGGNVNIYTNTSINSTGAKTVADTPLTIGTATGGANDFQLIINRSANGAAAHYNIQSVEQGISYRDLVLQKDGGSVGIRKSSPNAVLDVNGNTIISGSLIVTGDVQADYTPHFLLMGA